MNQQVTNFLMLLLIFMMGVGCNQETTAEDETVSVTFSTVCEGNSTSRAWGDASRIDSLTVGVFNARQDELFRRTFPVRSGSAEVNLRLSKGQTYHFVFWAYCSSGSLYDLTSLTDIRMGTSHHIRQWSDAEQGDAFYAIQKDITVSHSITQPITLTRPLAQVNVGTTGSMLPTVLTVGNLPTVFHPLTGTVDTVADITWHFEGCPSDTFAADGTTYTRLALAYLLAPLEETAVSCQIETSDNEQTEVQRFPVVHVQANHRTTIAGPLTRKTGSIE